MQRFYLMQRKDHLKMNQNPLWMSNALKDPIHAFDDEIVGSALPGSRYFHPL